MSTPTPDDLKRRARAAWAYSCKNQDEIAALTGINPRTLGGLLAPGGSTPSAEQAWAIAAASGVPSTFITLGWSTAADDRLATLEATLREVEARLAVIEAEERSRSDDTGPASGDLPR